jgi:transcriptional regulator with XRE-family HTH domain
MAARSKRDPRLLRQKLRLTLDEAGRRSKIERTRLWRWEAGYLRLRDEELTRLAEVLGVAEKSLPAIVSTPAPKERP